MFFKITKESPMYSELFTVLFEEEQRYVNYIKWQKENLPKFNGEVLRKQNPWHLFTEVVAWKFKDKVDDKVRQKVKDFPDYYEPNKRTKAGKEMRKKIIEAEGIVFDRFSLYDMFHTKIQGKYFRIPAAICYKNVIYLYFDDGNYGDISEKCAGMFKEITNIEWEITSVAYKKRLEMLCK